jgi:hypothetical protein
MVCKQGPSCLNNVEKLVDLQEKLQKFKIAQSRAKAKSGYVFKPLPSQAKEL